jgi:hypothetical protein
LEHPQAIEFYPHEQEAVWSKFREEHPVSDEMLERLRRTKKELSGDQRENPISVGCRFESRHWTRLGQARASN